MEHLNPKQNLFDTFQGFGNTYTIEYNLQFAVFSHIYKNGKEVKLHSPAEPIICASGDVIRITSIYAVDVLTTQRNGATHADTYTGENVITRSEILKLTLSRHNSIDETEILLTANNKYLGVFEAIKAAHADDFIIPISGLDEEYIINHSAFKIPSNAVELYALTFGREIELENGEKIQVLTDDGVSRLAEHLWGMCGASWLLMYSALIEEYEPLENYNSIEEEYPDISRKHKVSSDYKSTDTEKRDTSLTTSNNSKTNTNSIKAFNSSAFDDVSKNVESGSVTVSGDADDNITVTEHEQTGYTEDTESGSITVKRHGNIGVTTSQQMLQSEIELRTKSRIWEIMMTDADRLLTAPAYRRGLTKKWL